MASITVWVCQISHIGVVLDGARCRGGRSIAARPPKRVTSAICADGCATVRSGANNRPKNRGRNSRRLCNPSFPNLYPTTSATASRAMSPPAPDLVGGPGSTTCRSSVWWRGRTSSGAPSDVIVTAVADAGTWRPPQTQHPQLVRRRLCPLPADRPAKRLKPIMNPR